MLRGDRNNLMHSSSPKLKNRYTLVRPPSPQHPQHLRAGALARTRRGMRRHTPPPPPPEQPPRRRTQPVLFLAVCPPTPPHRQHTRSISTRPPAPGPAAPAHRAETYLYYKIRVSGTTTIRCRTCVVDEDNDDHERSGSYRLPGKCPSRYYYTTILSSIFPPMDRYFNITARITVPR